MTSPANPSRFTIALSFPGEDHRSFVKDVAAHLAATFGEERILYDNYHKAEFARLDLDVYLPTLYRTHSELIVLFLCPQYTTKRWCRLEWRSIHQLIATIDARRIMFLSFGNPGDLSELGILSGDGYLDIGTSNAEQIADQILKRLRLNQGGTSPPTPRPVPTIACKVDISRIDRYAPEQLIGREDETALFDDAWDKAQGDESTRPHVITLVAWGGEGKTSLVAKWAAALAAEDWPGCEAAFAWSFYSQGTREQSVASSDVFLAEALRFFGDAAIADSAISSLDKAKRLAELVGQRRALLILDGLDSLQYPTSSPLSGELKDHGISVLLKGLAARNRGLCVVTTRASLPDLRNFHQTTAPEVILRRLSTASGVELLDLLDVRGSQEELETLVENVRGHALTLNIIGQFLQRAYQGDIRRRNLVKFHKADDKIQGGHAFRAMAAYEKWLAGGSDEGRREVAILKLLGLFDRPADAGCINALTNEVIPGLNELLVGLDEDDWALSLTNLESAKLLSVNRDAVGRLLSLDTHPLIREYFAGRMQDARNSSTWAAAHRRLYEHLCAATPDLPDPTLEDLQPLYQAVAHGCHAGMYEQARDDVYRARIQRGEEFYSTRKLGALGADLGAVACFFEVPWSRLAPPLTEARQAWLLSEAAYRLRALGRLTEALEPMRAGLENYVRQENWKETATLINNLSELELTLGKVSGAVGNARQSVTYADRSGDAFLREALRTTHADALHQAGQPTDALAQFHEAEGMQAERRPNDPLLYSVWGFRYCDLLLATAECAAWLISQQGSHHASRDEPTAHDEPIPHTVASPRDPRQADESLTGKAGHGERDGYIQACRDVAHRAMQTLEWAEQIFDSLLDIALDNLTLGRATLYEALLSSATTNRDCYVGQDTGLSYEKLQTASTYLTVAVDGFIRAGITHYIPCGLLTRAWLRFLLGEQFGPNSAQSDFDDAWEITERGPMPLFMADIQLHRARLFGKVKDEGGVVKYPWESPAVDLAAARALITKHGYGRRLPELEDAEAAILGK